MTFRRPCLAALFAAALAAACSDEPKPAPAAPAPVLFEGLQLAGTSIEAKASGFRECASNGFYGFTCKRTEPTSLLGVRAKGAAVELKYPDGTKPGEHTSIPVEKMRYEGVALDFEPTAYDEKCVERERGQNYLQPIQCRRNDTGIDYLAHKLRESGWVGVESKGRESFYRPDSLAEVTIERRHNSVTLQPTSAANRDELIARVRDRHAQTGAQQAQDDKLKSLMQK
jgi:hypothetical protein